MPTPRVIEGDCPSEVVRALVEELNRSVRFQRYLEEALVKRGLIIGAYPDHKPREIVLKGG